MNMFYVQMGERIRQLRLKKKYSQEKLAENAHISTKFVYEIEKGICGCSSENLLYIANALEADCDYLLTGKVGNNFIDDEIYSYLNVLGNRNPLLVKQILKVIYENS